MAMVVQHNLTAMNANRQLGVITGNQSKSSEKLASGYRINRAGDDAAGLKISEKMRSQVRGLQRASTNAQDGVSLIQTAEGALNEAHSILQRMNELAVQGANDTNESIDREAINEELSQLTDELDRISSTTQFNKMNLLDGTFQNKNLHVGANVNQKIAISIDNMNAETLGLRSIEVAAVEGTDTVYGSSYELQKGVSVFGVVYKSSLYGQAGNTIASMKELAIGSIKVAMSAAATSTAYAKQVDYATGSVYYLATNNDTRIATAKSAMDIDLSAAKVAISNDITTNFATYLSSVEVSATTSVVLTKPNTPGTAGTPAQTLHAPSVADYAIANTTLKAVQEAINKVSSQRSALGAIQNRLEHTIANLDNVAENTQAAESRIRDTDIASEMVEYSKNQILAQAGQSMLAQGNQSTQGVLSLLQ